MKLRLSGPMTIDSIVDGDGIRAVVWAQGCRHACKGCHNPQTHSFEGGIEFEADDIIEQIKALRLHKGITLSGGDPFEQPVALAYVCREAKKAGLDVWAYTGYTFEELTDRGSETYAEWASLLAEVDVLVDGRFEEEKKSLRLKFRGSSNQRILDVKKSLEQGAAVIYEKYLDEKFE
ncbi:anaerobic ribonucleoside-triphosphate reductase-activating protein NrdG [Peptoclostridium acidaminophilum DSM 3953]|uniref:Anaerobic ribonucleoside-triphosphate reductase-activating protein n=1 Tax=Peptoclostridium acidaminophilum DSM 3953 TaxID=1286171 RepID=W8TLK3_PEPAC|nr:anaerobic ribonucleoside-triphosphate reductase activating protein [Peptoclostridium acidaminophilum]AHM57072.1 anaerobic ribonucleoside-triphosphate reductase-activating protein NrdG [Peptoclostridium acidaminophilum DSM 3953]